MTSYRTRLQSLFWSTGSSKFSIISAYTGPGVSKTKEVGYSHLLLKRQENHSVESYTAQKNPGNKQQQQKKKKQTRNFSDHNGEKNLSDIYTDMDQVLWKDVTLFDVNEIWVEFMDPLELKLKQTKQNNAAD